MNVVEDKAPHITPSSNQVEFGDDSVETASKKIAKTPRDSFFANIKPADEDDSPRGRQNLRLSTGN